MYKQALKFGLGGTLVGTFILALFSPRVISWYYRPPVELAISCTQAVDWGISTYQEVMIWGAVIGAVLGLVAFFVVLRKTVKNPP